MLFHIMLSHNVNKKATDCFPHPTIVYLVEIVVNATKCIVIFVVYCRCIFTEM